MGDSIEEFGPSELVLIGKNLPHFWQNYPAADLNQSKAYVIHFSEDFLGDKYFNLPELFNVQGMLKKAQRGLKIIGKTNSVISSIIQKFSEKKGFERLLLLQHILHIIAESSDYHTLASSGFIESFKVSSEERMKNVYEYVMYNFKNKISLPEIASVAAMSEIAFCRYFKRRTGKSFFTFLNEIRIGYSCRLLIERDLCINEICYESGFNSVSHFNRQFRDITNVTPKNYRSLYANKVNEESFA